MKGLFPSFNLDELAKQAQEFMAAIQAQIAELRQLRRDIDMSRIELNQLRGEVQTMRGQLQRIEAWTPLLSKAQPLNHPKPPNLAA